MPIYITEEEYELAADFGISRNVLEVRLRNTVGIDIGP